MALKDFTYEMVVPNEDLPCKFFIFEGKNGNYRRANHWHQSVEIFLVLEGELRFYINASVLSDLTNDNISASGAVYTITLLRDGEEFYRGIIGGVEGTLKDLNSGNISQNQLIASLKKGESSRITMKIGIDGESMNNDYQNTVGQLRLEFNVEQGEVATPDDVVIKKENVIYVEKPVKKTTEKKKDKTILERISTGDTTAVGLLAVIVFISGAAGILIIKRKGVKQHEK